MARYPALKLALELYHMPSRVRSARGQQLPAGIEDLLLISAGDEEAMRAAAEALERPQKSIKDAAAFFIEQILLTPEADSYRVLGARPDATPQELRRNMAMLLRFLHPDREHTGDHSVYAHRVIKAWEDVKTQERRDAYDSILARNAADDGRGSVALKTAKRPRSHNGIRSDQYHSPNFALTVMAPPPRPGILARALNYLLGRKA